MIELFSKHLQLWHQYPWHHLMHRCPTAFPLQFSLTLITLLIELLNEGLAPPYLRQLCCSTTQVQHCCYLCSAAQTELIVPRLWTASKQSAMSFLCRPWNMLPTISLVSCASWTYCRPLVDCFQAERHAISVAGPGICFLPYFAKYLFPPISLLPSRLFCFTGAWRTLE